ncbi:conserved Plasmodium protein, unknown function [Plasmodium vinckei lentum]|uniref:Uncharacterized protein n=1 Tax=Plasmodium vinckei lentum TaxID=138297 RepID=A0A6V7SW75_PLAVN|nr:conserved Plasmodium protein, unknown function [Plasmodium vinckei lentum]
MITDSEAPTYNFNSDDEAPCEYLNDVYAISEDTFSIKIIKQIGYGYYNPTNGHKVKCKKKLLKNNNNASILIYYELGFEDTITSADVYLGKNDQIPYVCEIALKCMKPNEVCIVQAPKIFKKIFRNSEQISKYDKKETFRVAFKKGLQFKKKCVEKYSAIPMINQLKRIKLSSNDVKLLLRKHKINSNNNNENKNTVKIDNDLTPETINHIVNTNPENSQNENTQYLKLDDINNLKYKFLNENDVCTFVIYLKDFCRVDTLNDDKTITKEIIQEGKGVISPKKNDYIDFFIQEKSNKEYIHMIFDLNNLRYRGLFKVLQNMKKGEISKITLKGIECFHINHSKENIYTNKGSEEKKMDSYNNHKAPVNNVDRSTCRNSYGNNSICNGIQGNTNNIETNENNISINSEVNKSKAPLNDEDNINNEITKSEKELIVELVCFKRSKTVNIKSIINMNRTEKLFFYLYEDNRKYYNKPIIDANCELIIHMSISKNINKEKRDKLFLPIKFYNSNNSYIKKSKAYFLFSYGSCFTSPIWFYESFKGMKEGDELIIPISKNKNICSDDYFIYHLLYDDIFLKDQTLTPIQKSISACVTKEIKNRRNNEEFVKERESIVSSQIQIEGTNTSPKKKKNIESSAKNTNLRNKTINHEKKFLKWLISNRNLGKGFFLINGLKKRTVDRFCKSFFSLQNHFIEEFNHIEDINRFPFYLRSFKKVKRNILSKKIVNIHKKKKIKPIHLINTTTRHHCDTYNSSEQIRQNIKDEKRKTKFSFIMNSLKSVYFDKNFYEKDAILKIKIVKILCKKKDSWNMSIKEQMEDLKIYNRIGNDFMKINLYYAASIYYKKGFDILRFSKISNLIFEEKKIDILHSQKDKQIQELITYMEKILTNLSNCLYKLNHYNESINFADKALIINPQNVKPIYWKNMSYLQLNKHNEILQNLNNSFCLNNTSLLKLYNTARMIKKTHDTKFNSLFYGMYGQK